MTASATPGSANEAIEAAVAAADGTVNNPLILPINLNPQPNGIFQSLH